MGMEQLEFIAYNGNFGSELLIQAYQAVPLHQVETTT